LRRGRGAWLALALFACAPPPAPLPGSPVPADGSILVQGEPVAMDPRDPKNERQGTFTYAGGLALTSEQTSRLHGLSDIKVWPDGRFLAQGDEADQVEGRLVLDRAGRLRGVTEVRLRALKDAEGRDLYALGTRMRDAEGVAEFPNGDRLVSFEQTDRVLLYPAAGGPPRQAPAPEIAWKFNGGMEALDIHPQGGPDAYVVGVEADGRTFVCRLGGGCAPDRTVPLPDLYELAALAVLPDGRRAYLLRAFDAVRGNRNILRIVGADGTVLDQLSLGRPLINENFEGVAAVLGRSGSVRFYLISDDNFGTYMGTPTGQRTLLLAFDWRPGGR
jgi:hypothetical protein